VRRTATKSFGMGKRESHDSSAFYARGLFSESSAGLQVPLNGSDSTSDRPAEAWPESLGVDDGSGGVESTAEGLLRSEGPAWCDRIVCGSSEAIPAPDASVALAFTSPPYNVGKDYDLDLSLSDYLALIGRVAAEVYRVLVPGGRYVVNIANLGRKPYIPLHALFYQVHQAAGFLPMGEVIWVKGRGASGNCAWGSWRSARSPRLRDLHEYLLVFGKEGFSRPERGQSDISGEDFMAATLSVWEIPPESARKVGHPAPFPVALANRVVKLFSYLDDVVLDPFCGSGTTCLAASLGGRHYLGVDVSESYCELARARLVGP
jgi:modification methylase